MKKQVTIAALRALAKEKGIDPKTLKVIVLHREGRLRLWQASYTQTMTAVMRTVHEGSRRVTAAERMHKALSALPIKKGGKA